MIKGGGPRQKKIMLLLFGSVALGLSRSPGRSFRIIKEVSREWKKINRQELYRSIKSLYQSKLVKEQSDSQGRIRLVLTEKGKERVLSYKIFEMEIRKPNTWDKKWRIVVFDIPETQKTKREILRMHLRNLHFFEFQKSVFVHPFECYDEIEYIIEYYQLRKYVRFIVAEYIDNELHLKNHYNLK